MSNILEQTLQLINRDEIKMKDSEVKRNNDVLERVTKSLIEELKKDAFFASIYERYFFGGSFYDGLKVDAPNEFDLDLVFTLPVIAEPTILSDSNYPAFVQVKFMKLMELAKNSYEPSLKHMLAIIEGEYLSIPKIMTWFQQRVCLAQNALGRRRDLGFKFLKTRATRGPAITFTIQQGDAVFDVDFVPCFKFLNKHWPSSMDGYRACPKFNANEQLMQEFLVVPKPKDPHSNSYFRLSFQGQERQLIENKGHLKPAIRLLKLYRNKFNDAQVKSYYFKTIALSALDDPTFQWRNQKLSSIFIQLFQRYIDALKTRKLPYYWNTKYNFFDACTTTFLQDASNRAERHLREFNSNDAARILKVFGVFERTQSRYVEQIQAGGTPISDQDQDPNNQSSCAIM